MEKKLKILLAAAAASTLIAGLLHLNRVIDTISNGEEIGNSDILFLIGGLAQIFWIVPIFRQWGKTWYSIGICGTVVFIILWVITRLPENPITGRAGPISTEAIIVQVFQIAFIILSAIILKESTKMKSDKIEVK